MTDLAGVKAIFSTSKPKLVLASYRSAIGDTTETLESANRIKSLVKKNAEKSKIDLFEWSLPLAPKNGTPTTSPSAQIFQNLVGVENLHTAKPAVVPALLAVNDGKLIDVLKGFDEVESKSEDFISKFHSYLKQQSDTSLSPQQKVGIFAVDPSQPSNATVDVEKLVTMGKDLMRKGQAAYAEKFFAKALGVLDAVGGQVDTTEGVDSDLEGSIAMTLAWLTISQVVQKRRENGSDTTEGRSPHNNTACNRLEKDYAGWITPLSDCARAVALRNLARYLPFGAEWDGATCSVKSISAELLEISAVANAQSAKEKAMAIKDGNAESKPSQTTLPERVVILRSLLVITHFLQGDLERAITEAIKLHVMKQEYGTIAMDNIVQFLGENDPLVVRSGWLAIKKAGI